MKKIILFLFSISLLIGQAKFFLPTPIESSNGRPIKNATVELYVAGTSTKQATLTWLNGGWYYYTGGQATVPAGDYDVYVDGVLWRTNIAIWNGITLPEVTRDTLESIVSDSIDREDSYTFSHNGKKIIIVNPYISRDSTFKGIIHCHTTNSDGADTPTEIVTAYKDSAYDFITISDHDTITLSPSVGGILFIPGVEISAHEGHLLCMGITTYDTSLTYAQDYIDEINDRDGVCFLAHPGLSSPNHWTDKEMGYINGYIGLEVFNGYGSNTYGEDQYNYLLSRYYRVFGASVDDCHDITGNAFTEGWIMVNSDDLTQTAIVNAIKKGNFYSSTGPDLSISLTERVITATTSDESKIIFMSTDSTVLDSALSATTNSYTIIGDEVFIYIKVIRDSDTTYAWSNPIYVDQLISSEISKGGLIRGNVYINGSTFIEDYLQVATDIGQSPGDTPDARLHIIDSSKVKVYLEDDDYTTFRLGVEADTAWLNYSLYDNLAIYEGTNSRLFIKNGGNVGLGTSAPVSKLSVGGVGITDCGIYGIGDKFGVYGTSDTIGVRGISDSLGVYGSANYAGVRASGGLIGLYATGTTWAGYFNGDIDILDTLRADGESLFYDKVSFKDTVVVDSICRLGGGVKIGTGTQPTFMEIDLYPTTADSMRFIIINPTAATKDTSDWIGLH